MIEPGETLGYHILVEGRNRVNSIHTLNNEHVVFVIGCAPHRTTAVLSTITVILSTVTAILDVFGRLLFAA